MSGRARLLDLAALSRHNYDPAWFRASYREWVATFGQPLDPVVEQARTRGYTLADVAPFLDCTRGTLSHLLES